MKKAVGLALFLAFTAGLFLPCSYADEISFGASVDKDRVALGDRLVLSLSITGARNATEPRLPRLDGFQVVSSGTTSQFNFIQGKMFASRSFTYVLVPQKLGKFTIGPALWEYEGKEYSTQPIDVEVVQGQVQAQVPPAGGAVGTDESEQEAQQPQGQLDLGDRLFIQVKTDKEEVYLNEQVILIFRLYRKNLSLDDLQYTPPPTVGFIEESLGKQKETRELINGVLYDVIELKTALFPASTGEMTIGPASLKCNVLVRAQRRRGSEEGFFGDMFEDSFFGGRFYDRLAKYPVDLKSKPLTVRVKPLPRENRPKDFKGAVGDFQMEAWIKPPKLKVGEPANLTMKIVGTGNVSSLQAPVVDGIEGFKTYDSESKVNLQERIDAIGGEKVFERVLIPQKAGKLKIPAVRFAFFNPRSARYETLSEGPFWLDVEESAEGRSSMIVSGTEAGAAKEDVQILKRDILFIKENLGSAHRSPDAVWQRFLFWWVQVVPLFLLLGTVYVQWRSERLHADVRLLRLRRAFGRAKEGLKQSEKLLAADTQDNRFYQTLYRALSDYVSDRWNLPAGEITPYEIDMVLVPKGLDLATAEKARNIMGKIDQGRFARAASGLEEKKMLLQETMDLIKDMEKKAK